MRSSRFARALALVLFFQFDGLWLAMATTNVVYSPDEASLRAAINVGGWVSIGFNGTVTLTNTIKITNNVVLDGENVAATISGGNAVRLFYVAPGVNFLITNLTLADGYVTTTQYPGTADGAAIYNDGGTVVLAGCTLANNRLESMVEYDSNRGAALFNNGGNVTLIGTTVDFNQAAIGGGYYVSPYGMVPNSGFSFGGAIYNLGGTMVIAGCNISSNFCSGSSADYMGGKGLTEGGAIYQSAGLLAITNSIFNFNWASDVPMPPPGQPYPAGGENERTSGALGGALAVMGGALMVDHSTFKANGAYGGYSQSYGSLSIPSNMGAGLGGAIYISAQAAINDTALVNNQAVSVPAYSSYGYDGCGGAIYNAGQVVLNRCLICSNYVAGGSANGIYGNPVGGDAAGGGIFNAGQLAATNCTIAENSAVAGYANFFLEPGGFPPFIGKNGSAFGGGLLNSSNATFSAMNLTIASNRCFASSGGSYTNGYTVITFLAGIAAGSQTANTNGLLALHNTIIAGTNGNTCGPITDDGCNLCSDGTANWSSAGSHNFTDPQLAPLADYGGPTLCMALLATSPAIDGADSSSFPSSDQRGFVRPIGSGPDIGAFEYGSYQLGVLQLDIPPTNDNVVLSYITSLPGLYRLQASTDMITWTDLTTNGPFASSTNLNQTVSLQGFNARFFRLLVQ